MARFKKGSAAAKRFMASIRPTLRSTKSKTRTMARKRTTKKRRTSKRSPSFMGINTNKALSAGIYGAIRARTSAMLAPYTSKIPLGNISDEVGLLVASSVAKKYLFKRAGILRDALNAGQTIELARVGEAIASGQVTIPFINAGGNNNAVSSGNIF